MCSTVLLEDVVVAVVDAEAEAGDAKLLESFKLVLLQRARLALEGDFFSAVKGEHGAESLEEPAQLTGAQIRGRAAGEVDELQAAAADDRQLRIELHFLEQGVEVGLDVARVLVGVDAEIAELAALAAERDVQIEPERRARPGRCTQRPRPLRQVRGFPRREWWIIRDKIVAETGLLLIRFERRHGPTSSVPNNRDSRLSCRSRDSRPTPPARPLRRGLTSTLALRSPCPGREHTDGRPKSRRKRGCRPRQASCRHALWRRTPTSRRPCRGPERE